MSVLENFTIEPSWDNVLGQEYKKDYFLNLSEFIKKERNSGDQIYPVKGLVFNAFKKTPYDRVKVVIIGQDPYHGEGQAEGLSFSVPMGIRQPPSLRNIFKELHDDLGVAIPCHGSLEKWAEQGVLLLNATLTVAKSKPLSHHNRGWEQFTDAVVHTLAKHEERIIFLLWGKNALQKAGFLAETHHHVLTAPHPSPFSAHNGFFGCRHFSMTNQLLQQWGKEPIDWQLD